MKILLDTSVLVAAMVEAHPAHQRALTWLKRVIDGPDRGLVAAHSLAELYAVLTRLPVHPRISPTDARRLIRHNILDRLEIGVLSVQDYMEVIDHLSVREITGGSIYDALILRVGVNADVDHVVTLNEGDFRRVYPELAGRIISP